MKQLCLFFLFTATNGLLITRDPPPDPQQDAALQQQVQAAQQQLLAYNEARSRQLFNLRNNMNGWANREIALLQRAQRRVDALTSQRTISGDILKVKNADARDAHMNAGLTISHHALAVDRSARAARGGVDIPIDMAAHNASFKLLKKATFVGKKVKLNGIDVARAKVQYKKAGQHKAFAEVERQRAEKAMAEGRGPDAAKHVANVQHGMNEARKLQRYKGPLLPERPRKPGRGY